MKLFIIIGQKWKQQPIILVCRQELNSLWSQKESLYCLQTTQSSELRGICSCHEAAFITQYNYWSCPSILGLLYRRFYSHAEGATLMQLYLSLIRPQLEYACPVWDPHTMKDKVLLEDFQKFALQMATKQWDSGYQELLDIMNVPSLADRRLQLKLALLYKIVHGMCYFPPDILSHSGQTESQPVR